MTASEGIPKGWLFTPESSWRKPIVRYAGLALIIASVQFFAAMFIEQALRPGYSDSANTISDLGVNNPALGWSYSWIFDGSIILLGILAILSIMLLVPVFPKRKLTYLGVALLVIGSAGAISVGVFTESYPFRAYGLSAHDYASVVTFVFANIGMTVMGLALRRHVDWNRYWIITFLLGFVSTVALMFYLYYEIHDVPGRYFNLGEGGLERVVAFPVLIWALIAGYAVYFHVREPSPPSTHPEATGQEA